MDVIKDFRTARRVDTPVVAIRTPDQGAIMRRIGASYTNGWRPALLRWDMVNGVTGLNEAGREVASGIDLGMAPTEAHQLAALMGMLPQGSILCVRNAHRLLQDPGIALVVGDYRDAWKGTGAADQEKRTLVLLGPSFTLPDELAHDVWLLTDPLPDREELGALAGRIFADVYGQEPDADTLGRAVDGLAGLPAYLAEQAFAMSLRPEGVDLDALWARKRQMIRETKGLSIVEDAPSLDELGGLAAIKEYIRRLTARNRYGCVLWVDEMEKAVGNAEGDLSGVKADALGHLLQWTAGHQAKGSITCVLLVGVAGSGKSALAQATGRTAGVPTVRFDLGEMKGSLVGESEQAIRTGTEIADVMAGGQRILLLATANSVSAVPSEFQGRFVGTWFFDVPTEEERAAIWPIHRARWGVPEEDPAPAGTWTGREIMMLCQQVAEVGCTLDEARRYVVQRAIADRARIEAWRMEADGNFLAASGSDDGIYRRPRPLPETVVSAPQGRTIAFDE